MANLKTVLRVNMHINEQKMQERCFDVIFLDICSECEQI